MAVIRNKSRIRSPEKCTEMQMISTVGGCHGACNLLRIRIADIWYSGFVKRYFVAFSFFSILNSQDNDCNEGDFKVVFDFFFCI